MCKFHQDIALDVARRPDGTIDPLAFTLNVTLVGTCFSIGDYIPEMEGLGGYEVYQMASQKGQHAFAQSGLAYDPEAFAAYRNENLPYLQERTRKILSRHSDKIASLPKLKDFRSAAYFINTAPDALYAPFGPQTNQVFFKAKDEQKYGPLRSMAADYWDDPQTKEILAERFKQSVAVTFMEAKEKANPTLLKLYEKLPNRAKAFASCAGGVCTSAGGTFLGHLGCVIKMAVLPLILGEAGAHNPGLMYGMMGGGTALGLSAWEYLHYRRGSVGSKIEKIVTYGTALVSLTGFMAWHTLTGNHDEHMSHDPRQKKMESLIQTAPDGKRYWVNDGTFCGPRTRAGDTIWLPSNPTIN